MSARRRISLAALAFLALIGAAFAARGMLVPEPVRLVVDRQTTHVLSPLLPDGTVDFGALYAPGRDTLPAWSAAASLIPREPPAFQRLKAPLARTCADRANDEVSGPWLRASEAAMAKLKEVRADGWPDPSTAIVRERVFAFQGDRQRQALPSLVSLAHSILALECRCGVEAGRSPDRAVETVAELSALAAAAERAAEEIMLILATQAATAAVACAEVIASGSDHSLLHRVELAESSDSASYRLWFIEQRRLRVLDAVVDAFYKRPRVDVDINLMLTLLNRRFDAIERGGKVEPAVEILERAVRELRIANWIPVVAPWRVRVARTKVRASAVALLTEPSTDYLDTGLRVQQGRLAELVRHEVLGRSSHDASGQRSE